MPIQITSLRHWKREYACLENCEDAVDYSEEDGLFAISDGVGMASFSHIWSRILVERFIKSPFFDANAFEVSRWLRAAQQQFKSELPDPESIPAHLRGVLDTLTAATFLGAFIQSETIEGELRVTLQLLGLGDSCALHCRDKACIDSFPLQKSADFDRAPDVLYSRGLNVEDTKFKRYEVDLRAGDLVILATDAVAQWLLYGEAENAESQAVRSDRVAMLIAQTEESWPHFVEPLRNANLMVDDDSTALIIHAQTLDSIAPHADALLAEIKKDRFKEFKQAYRNQKKSFTDLALAFGSGTQLSETCAAKPKYKKRAMEAQRRAQHFYRLLAALRPQIEKPNDANMLALKNLWIEGRDQLLGQAEAEGVIATLEKLGIPHDFQFTEPAPGAIKNAESRPKGISHETKNSSTTDKPKAERAVDATGTASSEAASAVEASSASQTQRDQTESALDKSKKRQAASDEAVTGERLSDLPHEPADNNQPQMPLPKDPEEETSSRDVTVPQHSKKQKLETKDKENSIPDPPPLPGKKAEPANEINPQTLGGDKANPQ